MALEPRVLFDGALADTTRAGAKPVDLQAADALDLSRFAPPEAVGTPAANAALPQLVIVECRVPDAAQLAANADLAMNVLLLDAQHDGGEQISKGLAKARSQLPTVLAQGKGAASAMQPGSMLRRWLAFGCMVLALAGHGAAARTVLDLDVASQPVMLADWGDWWIDPTGSASLEQVLALPERALRPTSLHLGYRLGAGQALWIRFTVPPAPDAESWYLALPDSRLDVATLYTRVGDSWKAQSAGDHIAVGDWPMPNDDPLLPLAVSAAEPGFFVLRLEASEGFTVAPRFVSERSMSVDRQRLSVLNGLYFGLLAMATLFALACAVIFRDRGYLWFGVFVLLIDLTVARTVGMAGLHLWPRSPHWNDAAEHVLAMLSLAPLLGFAAVTVSLRARHAPAYWAVCALALLALSAGAGGWLLPVRERLALTLVVIIVGSAAALAAVGWVCWRGDRFARWLLLSFTPMLAALPFPVGRWLGWLPQSLLSEHGIQLALVLTLPATLLVMMTRSQERLDYRRRITRLEQVDPLTGLLNDEVFGHRLRGMIERSARLQCESAVVVVEFTNLDALGREFGRKAVLEVMLRLAGRLTSMVRPMDTVARIGEARYGVLFEGPVPPDRAAQLGSKFLARLILPFSRLPTGLAVKVKVAVVLVPAQAADAAQALERIDGMLNEAPPDHPKSVYVINSQPVSVPTPRA